MNRWKQLNKPDSFYLALVEVDGEETAERYVQNPFQKEPDFSATSVNYDIKDLLTCKSEKYFTLNSKAITKENDNMYIIRFRYCNNNDPI